jgi:hypothetical protein
MSNLSLNASGNLIDKGQGLRHPVRFVSLSYRLRRFAFNAVTKLLGKDMQSRTLVIDFDALWEHNHLDSDLQGSAKADDGSDSGVEGGKTQINKRPVAWIF